MSAATDLATLDAVFKAYDVRGTVPDELDVELTRKVGNAFVQVTLRTPRGDAEAGGAEAGGAEAGSAEAGSIVVGHDMRPSSPDLALAYAAGATDAGADVTMIGLASTDQLYFASGHLGVPGAMITASHNPGQYNGIKQCRAYAVPLGMESGLAEVRSLVADGRYDVAAVKGTVTHQDLLAEYADHLHRLAPVRGRRIKVVVDAGNGMAGHTAPAVLGGLDLDVTELYYELDGTFPNHEANPIEPDNLRDLRARVVAEQADIGLAFDGDADRCFVVDERGRPASPSVLTALVAARELSKHPGSAVIHNLITSRVVPETVRERGGTPIRTRVGHSYIKATMAETDAVFGGEHSGHFYFRDFWRADSGMLAALHILAALAESQRPLSQLLAHYTRYASSGEINSTVADQHKILAQLGEAYAGRPDVTLDHLDGLTVTAPHWWFNVRPSNTEPLLRLNAEGDDEETMAEVRDQVLHIIRRDA